MAVGIGSGCDAFLKREVGGNLARASFYGSPAQCVGQTVQSAGIQGINHGAFCPSATIACSIIAGKQGQINGTNEGRKRGFRHYFYGNALFVSQSSGVCYFYFYKVLVVSVRIAGYVYIGYKIEPGQYPGLWVNRKLTRVVASYNAVVQAIAFAVMVVGGLYVYHIRAVADGVIYVCQRIDQGSFSQKQMHRKG